MGPARRTLREPITSALWTPSVRTERACRNVTEVHGVHGRGRRWSSRAARAPCAGRFSIPPRGAWSSRDPSCPRAGAEEASGPSSNRPRGPRTSRVSSKVRAPEFSSIAPAIQSAALAQRSALVSPARLPSRELLGLQSTSTDPMEQVRPPSKRPTADLIADRVAWPRRARRAPANARSAEGLVRARWRSARPCSKQRVDELAIIFSNRHPGWA
jgi:hypothetical protein